MTVTFRDFVFRCQHHMPSKSGAASLPHWHTYTVRFWFSGAPDQDWLSCELQKRYSKLHGSSLNSTLEGRSSDEDLAEWFFSDIQELAPCIKVTVTNDYQRGAEASK
jgi:hypothetical protein